MKKIINGKKYDTETAKEVAEYCSWHGKNDFRYFEETLYRKKNGEFFLYGEGRCASPYTEDVSDGTTGGSGIAPLTENEAKKWAEEKIDSSKYEAIFGEVEE